MLICTVIRENFIHLRYLTKHFQSEYPLKKSYLDLKRKYRRKVKLTTATTVMSHFDKSDTSQGQCGMS